MTLHDRKTGVLAHISSLPGEYGIGDLGDGAHEFVRILASAGVRAWQMLPLAPTEPGTANSPYSSTSAFAGNRLFISPERLASAGLLAPSDLAGFKMRHTSYVDYDRVYDIKEKLLLRAYDTFRADGAYRGRFKKISDDFWDFCVSEAWWLEDFALFSVLKELENGAGWNDWRDAYKFRDWSVLDPLKAEPRIARMLDVRRFEQFLFFSQLDELLAACREADIEVIGDLPIYVACDSADVWGHQELFLLDDEGRPSVVAGVPPDYFSETGQRWGNPIYRWERMRQEGYGWWIGRVRHALRCADRIRIDHFRGFMGYWEIPAEEPTAVNGEWRCGPGLGFFAALKHAISPGEGERLPFIAEDLGVVTEDVVQAMNAFGLPGMKVLQFAFGEGMPQNIYAPHNHVRDSVVFVGTHDNNTTAGWWNEDATETERENFLLYIDRHALDGASAADAMVRMAFASTSNLAVLTLQDILRLDADARMNTPSTTEGNWAWRLENFGELATEAGRLRDLGTLYGRYVPIPPGEIAGQEPEAAPTPLSQPNPNRTCIEP